MTFQDQLKKLGACSDAVEWVGNRTAQKAWDECKKGNWMLWLINNSKLKVTLAIRKKLVLCACDIAETSLKYLPKDEKRPAEALRVARAWVKGEKTIEEVKTAAKAANAANAANAAYAAANAVYAAAYAVNAAYATYAANAAAKAANAANAANAAANAANAAIVRKYFPKPPRV